MSKVNSVTFGSLAKTSGSGRKTKWVGFVHGDDSNGDLIVGELDEIVQTDNGQMAVVKAADNNEIVQVFLSKTTLYSAGDYKKIWVKDTKGGIITRIDFDETEKALKLEKSSTSTSYTDDTGTTAKRTLPDQDAEPRTRANLSHYVLHKNHQTEGGRPVFDVDDDVAKMLIDLPHKEIIPFTARTLKSWGVTEIGRGKAKGKVTVPALTERWGHLNKGQIRMNAGNVLRSAFKKRIDEGKE